MVEGCSGLRRGKRVDWEGCGCVKRKKIKEGWGRMPREQGSLCEGYSLVDCGLE